LAVAEDLLSGKTGVAVAVGAAAVALVAAAAGGYVVGHHQPSAGSGALAAVLSHEDARVSTFSGRAQGTLAVAYRPGHTPAVVFGSGLAAVPDDRVYELWAFGPSGRPAPSGTFTTAGGPVVVTIAGGVSNVRAMAVTLERAPGAHRPTTQPVLTTRLH
jgi:hypothetical protein